MTIRAKNSGIRLNASDAAIVKGMLNRGDRQHDIAAWFGVNPGRIAEVKFGDLYHLVPAASGNELPPVGPYPCGRDSMLALEVISKMKATLTTAEELIFNKRA